MKAPIAATEKTGPILGQFMETPIIPMIQLTRKPITIAAMIAIITLKTPRINKNGTGGDLGGSPPGKADVKQASGFRYKFQYSRSRHTAI